MKGSPTSFIERIFGLPSYRLKLIRGNAPFAGENTCMVFRKNGNKILYKGKKITNNRNKAGNTRMDKWIHGIWIWANQVLKYSGSVGLIKLFDFFGWKSILTFYIRMHNFCIFFPFFVKL
jgi:hypothetical protein